MDINILTAGYCNRHSLYDQVQKVLDSANISASVEQIEDMEDVLSYGVMTQTRLLATFFGSAGLSIVALGYVFNWILQPSRTAHKRALRRLSDPGRASKSIF